MICCTYVVDENKKTIECGSINGKFKKSQQHENQSSSEILLGLIIQ